MRSCVSGGQCCGSSAHARQRNPEVRHPASILSNARCDWTEAGNLPAHRPALCGNLASVMGRIEESINVWPRDLLLSWETLKMTGGCLWSTDSSKHL